MIYKPSLITPVKVAYLVLSTCITSHCLMAQEIPIINSSSATSTSLPDTTSNLVSNNPFVPKNNRPINKTNTPNGPQSIANKTQVLQKYLQFKSIAIINKKKYYSIFNKRANKSFWISEGETVENFSVKNYNPRNNTISITDGINTEIIPIITANETPLSVTSAALQANQEVTTPQIPEQAADQNKNKQKPPPRRRVVPLKR